MGNFRDLEVWSAGRSLVKAAYQLSNKLPEKERFGLISQIQRAAVSVPCNIAEGAGRMSDPDFARFLRFSLGSLNELETLFLLCEDLDYLTADSTAPISKMMRDLGVRLRNLVAALSKRTGVKETVAAYNAEQPDPDLGRYDAIDSDF